MSCVQLTTRTPINVLFACLLSGWAKMAGRLLGHKIRMAAFSACLEGTLVIIAFSVFIELAPCGSNVMTEEARNYLYSPGWPGDYDNNQQCEWRITATNGKQVQLTMTSLDIELCCDTLEVSTKQNN